MGLLDRKEVFKEKIIIKKEFIRETLNFENKIFFAFLAFIAALAIFVFQNPDRYNGFVVLGITFLFFLMEAAVQNYRTKKFNEIMQEVETGIVSPVQIRPIEQGVKKSEIRTVTSQTKPAIQTETKTEDNEITRLTIVALLIAIMFGILEIFPASTTFDDVGINAFLKVTASTSLYVPFFLFGCYLLLLAHNSRYKNKMIFKKLQAFFYDFATAITIYIVLLSALFLGCVKLLMTKQNFPIQIITSVIWLYIIISVIIIFFSFKKHLPYWNRTN